MVRAQDLGKAVAVVGLGVLSAGLSASSMGCCSVPNYTVALDSKGDHVANETRDPMDPQNFQEATADSYGSVVVRPSLDSCCCDGVRYLWQEDWDEAEQAFRQAVTKNPKDHRAAYALAVVLERRGDYQEAHTWYRRANATDFKMQYNDGILRTRAVMGEAK